MILAASLLLLNWEPYRVGTTWEYALRSSYQLDDDPGTPVDVERLSFRVTSIKGSDIRVAVTQKFVETVIGEAHIPATTKDSIKFDIPWSSGPPTDWKSLIPDRGTRWAVWFLIAAQDHRANREFVFRDQKANPLATLALTPRTSDFGLSLTEPFAELTAEALGTLKFDQGLPVSLNLRSDSLLTPGGNRACRWKSELVLTRFTR